MPRVSGISSRQRPRTNAPRNARDNEIVSIPTRRTLLLARNIFSDNAVVTHSVGLLSHSCQYCTALHFGAEKIGNHFNSCCHNGKVSLPNESRLKPPHREILKLLTENTENAKNYRANIRKYNAALAFASVNANVVNFSSNGPYVYKIQGQIYYQVSHLHPELNGQRRYGQLYMIEASEATDTRMSFPENFDCSRRVMTLLLDILHENNQYARVYKSMRQIEMEMHSRGERVNDLKIMFRKDSRDDRRRYNLPATNEVAALFVSVDGSVPANIEFSIFTKSGNNTYLKTTSPHADPMCYPLLFIHGEQGWNEFLQHDSTRATIHHKRLTLLQFYAYRLAIRPGVSLLHLSGKLFQQFIVDAYCKVESNNLNYLRFNQSKLRAECYQGLVDHINNNNENNEAAYPVGRMVILPSSFIGSPRNMHQNYQDAMAIVRKNGKPDLFITFTCNPKWAEIENSLGPLETTNNRPDLISRVFSLKLKELMHDITKRNIFGVPGAYIYVVEFQKRGLPHAHILLTLRDEDKLRTPDDIDKVISAEIPDYETHPRLFEIVTRNMLHGPCGEGTNSVCMENNKCTKGFPKEFYESTLHNFNGYPSYERPNNGRYFTKTVNGVLHNFDNRNVVPHNPYLLYKYNAHINVESCVSMKSVEYIHKYIYKGHDCANVQISDENDEITRFQHFRYVGPSEAMWRLLEKPLHDKSHTVIRLQIAESTSSNVQ